MIEETKTIEMIVTKIVVVVSPDEDTGFDGSLAELEEAVTQNLLEDIEGLQIEGTGWMSDSITVHTA